MAIRSGNYSHWNTHNYCKRQNDQLSAEEGFDSFHFIEPDHQYDEYSIHFAPSEDIWKKFELIPTPPLSPRRDDMSTNGICLSPCSTTDKLRLVSEKLDDPISYTVVSDDYFCQNASIADLFPTTLSSSPSPSPGLISDCMWSAQFKDIKTENTPKPKVTIRLEKADLSSYTSEMNNSEDCVDPTAVFPFSIVNERSLRSDLESQPDTESSEDEEIDVVTVPKLAGEKMRNIQVSSRNPNSLLNPVSFLNNKAPTLHISFEKRSNKVLTLKRKSMSLPASPEPREKRIKRENSVPELTKLVSPPKKARQYTIPEHSYQKFSNDEDDYPETIMGESREKRAQHNVLERKRRYDLKYSFMVLRDVIPQLESQERAAKVVILQKAVECIQDLHLESRELLKRKDFEIRRREALERQLEELKSYCY